MNHLSQNPVHFPTDNWGIPLPRDLYHIGDALAPSYSPSLNAYYNYARKGWFLDANCQNEATYERIHGPLSNHFVRCIASPEETHHNAEFYRSIVDFEHKAKVRTEATMLKQICSQQLKHRNYQFVSRANGYHIIVTNGFGEQIEDILAFTFLSFEAFLLTTEKNALGIFFSISGTLKKDKFEFVIFSDGPISVKALKKSPFLRYYVPSPKYEKFAWDSVCRAINGSTLQQLQVPQHAGWQLSNDRAFFWGLRSDQSFAFLPDSVKIRIKGYDSAHDVSDSIITNLNEICNAAKSTPEWGIIFFLRTVALLLPLLKSRVKVPSFYFWGDNAFDLISKTLNVFDGIDNVINLSVDNKATIKNKLSDIGFSPVICFSGKFAERTIESRIQVLNSLITVSDQNCLLLCSSQGVDSGVGLFDVVLDVADCRPSDIVSHLDQWQRFLIDSIEGSGKHWIEKLDQFLKIHHDRDESIFPIVGAVKQFIVNIIEPQESEALNSLLNIVSKTIEEQAKTPFSSLLEVFKMTVVECVENGTIIPVDRHQAAFASREANNVIFFDDYSYFIKKNCFLEIIQGSRINEKAKLRILQDLDHFGYLKTYRVTSSHREYLTDFTVNYAAASESLSGYAISSAFFDEDFGLKLYERGKM